VDGPRTHGRDSHRGSPMAKLFQFNTPSFEPLETVAIGELLTGPRKRAGFALRARAVSGVRAG